MSSKRGSWEATAVNVSLTGIRIRFPTEADPAFRKHEHVLVTLDHAGINAEMPGVVRYCEGSSYGVLFLRTADESRALVRAVEQDWLSRRVRPVSQPEEVEHALP